MDLEKCKKGLTEKLLLLLLLFGEYLAAQRSYMAGIENICSKQLRCNKSMYVNSLACVRSKVSKRVVQS